MEFDEGKNTEAGIYFKVTEIIRLMEILKKDQPESRSRTEEGGLESKRVFEGSFNKDVFFSGFEKSTVIMNKSQNKLKANLYVNQQDNSKNYERLCTFYKRFVFDYSKPITSAIRTRIIVETPQCSKSNFVNTRFNGEQTKDNEGVLNIIHAPEEDPCVFINNLYNAICRSSEKEKNLNKLRKFNQNILGEFIIANYIQRLMYDQGKNYGM